MLRLVFFLLIILSSLLVKAQSAPKPFVLSTAALKNKIKGGWAGQTIGVTFGGPYEFRFQGSFIGDYQPLLWYDGYLKKTMIENPGLYDDLYMDLTFVEVLEKYGLSAPVDSFAQAYAHAGYMLWHANQVGRYNILNGLSAPQSGYWKNNPHADCIDYQIEADFAGLMSPAMPNAASAMSDKVGHIMNYGDGWYGGIFVGAMYAEAFRSKNISQIVTEALKTIPPQSDFYQCIYDVVQWHKKYPADWRQTWMEVQKRWADDVGCPDGVFSPFNIDAKVNAAYVVIGLLYGHGDFTQTLEITTRCGQDADCNPSTAGGVLGTVLGYDAIPAYWKQGLKEAEDIKFKYTNMSLNDVYEVGYRHALETIKTAGGTVDDNKVFIRQQAPVAVQFEKSFPGLYPVEKILVHWSTANEVNFSFDGIGFVLRGDASKGAEPSNYVFKTELMIDGKKRETINLPADFTTRRYDLAYAYDLPKGHHTVTLKLTNPSPTQKLAVWDVLVYADMPVNGLKQQQQKAARFTKKE